MNNDSTPSEYPQPAAISKPPASQPALPGPVVDPRSSMNDGSPSMPPRAQSAASAPSPASIAPVKRAPDGLDRVLSIGLTIHVELGRRKIRVGDLLKLGAGQVLELDAGAGAPLSIYANNTLIAEGEAVVVGERYGIRITDIVSPAERVQRLGKGDKEGVR